MDLCEHNRENFANKYALKCSAVIQPPQLSNELKLVQRKFHTYFAFFIVKVMKCFANFGNKKFYCFKTLSLPK